MRSFISAETVAAGDSGCVLVPLDQGKLARAIAETSVGQDFLIADDPAVPRAAVHLQANHVGANLVGVVVGIKAGPHQSPTPRAGVEQEIAALLGKAAKLVFQP